MRREWISIMFAGLIGVCASPLQAATRPAVDESHETAAPVAVQRVSIPATSGLRDEAAMVLVGTALIGLAAAVRRAA